MRSLAGLRNFDQPPQSLLNLKTEQEAVALEEGDRKIYAKKYKGTAIEITDPNDYYFGHKEFEIRYLLRKTFYNKCVYCERVCYKPDVEHFRPKGKIGGRGGNDHGYFWLCYNWSNLLPSCPECNRPPAKHDKFPVAGTRIVKPLLDSNNKLIWKECKADSFSLSGEQAKLLHPEVDTPEVHLRVLFNGKIEVRNNSKRGAETIKICDLNRANLIVPRKKIVDDVVRDIRLYFNFFRTGKIDNQSLEEFLKEKLCFYKFQDDYKVIHSLVYHSVFEFSDEFVASVLSDFSATEQQFVLKVMNKL